MRRWLTLLFEMLCALGIHRLTTRVICRDQLPITQENGRGWDGQVYVTVAEQYKEFGTAKGGAPFIFRPGTGMLAAKIAAKYDLTLEGAFFLVNSAANILLTLLFVWLARIYIRRLPVRLMVYATFITFWAGPYRLAYHQIFVDSLAHVVVAAGLVAIYYARKRPTTARTLIVTALSFAGAWVREVAVLLPLGFALAMAVPLRPDRRLSRFVEAVTPLAAFVLGTLIMRQSFVATLTNGYTIEAEITRWIYGKPLPMIVHGFFLTFGVIPALLLVLRREVSDFARRAPDVAFMAASFCGLAYIGGDSTERLLAFASIPLFMLFGNVVSRRPELFAGFPMLAFVVVQTLTNRVFWSIPDYPHEQMGRPWVLLLPIGENATYEQWWSAHLGAELQKDSLWQYFTVSLLVFLWCTARSAPRLPRFASPMLRPHAARPSS